MLAGSSAVDPEDVAKPAPVLMRGDNETWSVGEAEGTRFGGGGTTAALPESSAVDPEDVAKPASVLVRGDMSTAVRLEADVAGSEMCSSSGGSMPSTWMTLR